MIFGWFDFFIISLVIYLNFKFWKIDFRATYMLIVIGHLFFLVFLFFSLIVEINREMVITDFHIDLRAFYGILKFPLYWVLGIVQIIVFGFNKQEN